MMACKGTCSIIYKGTRGQYFNHGYKNIKRCSVCQIGFSEINQNRCPCCNQLLRSTPRQKKRKYYDKMKIAGGLHWKD